LIAHFVDPGAQPLAAGAGEDPLQAAAVFGLKHLPTTDGEELLELGNPDPRHHAIEALAVEIDDPEQVAKAMERLLDDRLPHVALVQLRVTDQRDPAPRAAATEVTAHVVVGQSRHS